ncbi:hypothetical protein OHA98_37465 [Streptomyces sp. NBC_00654]|uniref:hypothetical protein n=1 Tax=Streptomyces sp. NBC_00654 TaxID=2975799 RepID=UPI00225AA7F8|nr:hypothetical protein [Streptomyces sp. NBC_00654]MCX4970355.1 hypothetical protein [Streptomyces sp. NBC_00654]
MPEEPPTHTPVTAASPAATPLAPWLTAPLPGGAGHSTSTVERGSFCLARCSCGWSGPARRSRDRARSDAEQHLAAP